MQGFVTSAATSWRSRGASPKAAAAALELATGSAGSSSSLLEVAGSPLVMSTRNAP